jgi:ribosome-binding protein aMBF1 (putative translation factor)
MRRAAAVTRARPRRDDDADERAELLTRFARQLRRYRTAEGFTQDRLAAKIGRGRLHVVRLEGAQPEPSLVTLTRLSRALAVPIGGLLEWRHAAMGC